MKPDSALPTENFTLRTTWLKLIALDVSPGGVTASITPGMAAENVPTPSPSAPHQERFPRPGPGQREDDQGGQDDGRAAARMAVRARGAERVHDAAAANPSAENGTGQPGHKDRKAEPYPVPDGVSDIPRHQRQEQVHADAAGEHGQVAPATAGCRSRPRSVSGAAARFSHQAQAASRAAATASSSAANTGGRPEPALADRDEQGQQPAAEQHRAGNVQVTGAPGRRRRDRRPGGPRPGQ